MMKSLNSWRANKILNEFVGPAGQVDPTGQLSASMPQVFPKSPIGSARPGMAPSAMVSAQDDNQTDQDQDVNNQPQVANDAQPQDPNDILPPGLQRYIKILSSKPTQQIIAVRTAFNQALQSALMAKNKSAGRMGMMANFNQARGMKMNFGQPVASPEQN
jgi:hypothetical protein